MQNKQYFISSIHNARETLVQLMDKQGYDISEYENISLTETNAKHSNEQLDMLFDKHMQQRQHYTRNIHQSYLGKFASSSIYTRNS